MKVSEFMIPADKVVRVSPMDTVQTVMDLMLERHIGALIVMDDDEAEHGGLPVPLGIITKTDIAKAYKTQIPIDDPCKAMMNQGELITCTPNIDREKAARILKEHHTHHLVVVDEESSHFLGLISSFDITAECANGPAWLWNFLPRKELNAPITESQRADAAGPESIFHHKHDKTQYEDYVDLLGFQ
ncbi:CBS [Seminavis robusta]|uniref:CBS n=1 Tax=Seminavis robusta TaxID=568900 RepID=A0A9N8EY54_9STRA|nr:CBS [Seminavis robusta]|eukprot:Sro2363_g324950.1 CBS (187) ;mRNA; f:11965-12525